MKNVFRKLILLTTSLFLISCSGHPSNASDSKDNNSSSVGETHHFSNEWEYDETHHWHACTDKGCTEKGDYAPHVFGEPTSVDPSTLKGKEKYAFVSPRIKRCECGYYEIVDGTNILPELRFNFSDKNSAGEPQEVNFMNIATKKDVSRPEVEGKYTLTNCPGKAMEFKDVTGTMKVRGNQTAGWRKKAFRIKFDSKRSMMGLNGGGQYKKWVLLADAKDTTLIRSAAGLYISREICKDDSNIWVCDYTPVTVYLNNEYWGYYYLAEQKEVNKNGNGRIHIPEVEKNYTGTDIGYCIELDYYADGKNGDASEKAKGADGDPTFRMKYTPEMLQGHPSGPLASGQIDTYTMLSDITDSTATGNQHTEADYNGNTKTSNSGQLTFIRDRMEALYQVLYYATKNQSKEINDQGQVVNSSKSIEENFNKYFDLNAWVNGFIISAFSCPPDLGYSSFYMTYDNSPTGDKKLRFDCPWDFDSNFGNRLNFNVNADQLYVDNTYNTWIYMLSKLTFFMNAVKAKWNTLRNNQVFEGMFQMMRKYFKDYDLEIKRNHYRWPENDAASREYNNFDEIREPFVDPANYKEAETETINWCAKRVNFLEKKWGNNRPNVNTGA